MFVSGGDEGDDGEPDKMMIAFGRFGRLKRWIGASVRNALGSCKRAITGRPQGNEELALEATEEKDFQVRLLDVLKVLFVNIIPFF